METAFHTETVTGEAAPECATSASASAPKKRGRPSMIKPPSMSLFSADYWSGAPNWSAILRDTHEGFDVLSHTVNATMRVVYAGPTSRQECAKLRDRSRFWLDAAGIEEAVRTLVPSDSAEVLRFTAEELASALDYLLPAVSRDPTRYSLSGVHLRSAQWEATDGHRLHVLRGLPAPSVPAIVPLSCFATLRKAVTATKAHSVALYFQTGASGREVRCRISGEHLAVEIRETLPDAQFPNCDAVIPSNDSVYQISEIGNAQEIRDALRYAPINGTDKGAARTLRFTIEGGAHVAHAVDAKLSASVVLPFQRAWIGNIIERDAPFIVNLCSRYLDDALSELDGEVLIRAENEMAPVVITDRKQRLAVVMPMRR